MKSIGTPRAVLVTAFTLGAALLLVTAGAWAQFANDGARQNASGGWDMPYDFCSEDAAYAAAYTTQETCEAVDATWNTQTNSCFLDREQCRRLIYFGVWASGPGGNINDPLYDTQGECTAAGREWAAACSDGVSRNQSSCTTAAATWYSSACRGLFSWPASYGFPTSSSAANYRNDCTRCHNSHHYPDNPEGNGETYAMTGHKNMARPLVRSTNTDPHYMYQATDRWAGASGSIYSTVNWATALWIYDGWIAAEPRSLAMGGSYSCGRCHTTGWTSDAAVQTTKEPERSFPFITWDGVSTFDPLTQVKLGSGVAGDPNPNMSSWDQWGIQCSRCHGSQLVTTPTDLRHHPDVPNKQVVGSNATGATRTNLCLDCHRQETGGLPYDGGATPAALKVGNAHGTVEFVSHWHGNLFLNSPHGRFTGTSAEIWDKTKYDTHFKNEGEAFPFQGNQGGCAQCHNVHKSTVPAANPAGGAIHEECTECHAKNLNVIKHPTGAGTPLENMLTNPAEACEICHMPGALHLFRVNVDAGYSTFPEAAITSTSPTTCADNGGTWVTGSSAGCMMNASTAAEDTYTGAVWVDLDHSCGQCHGGGSNQLPGATHSTTGTMSASSKALTVANATGFALAQRIKVAGAGAAGAALETYITSIAGSTINLYAAAATAVTNAVVQQNPTAFNAGYISKADVEALATAIHNDVPYAAFNFTYGAPVAGPPATVPVNFNAGGSTCSGSAANCNAYNWDFGDATTGTGVNPIHSYPAPAVATNYNVTMTVHQYGVNSASITRVVTIYPQNFPPAASGLCTPNVDNWSYQVTDTSTDAQGIKQVAVNWGDGTMLSNDVAAPFGPFNHTFLMPGTFRITKSVFDTAGNKSTQVCGPVTIAYFSIAGTVTASNGTTVVPGALITVKKAGTTVRTLTASTTGTFNIGYLKPGTHTLFVTKAGYVFDPAGFAFTVGPSTAGNNISSTTP